MIAAKPPNLHDLVYSTNRGSEGKDLDVWSARVLFDREPHVGGWDLWCATRDPSGAWATPQPLSAVNTPSDEFRPSLFTFEGAHFMVFSSSRPGGAGGYDPYTVRFDRCSS